MSRAEPALVPEGRRIYGSLTVAENLRLGLAGRRSGDGAGADVALVETLFPVVREFASRNAGALSGGQQQQLAIARALVARPDVLLLDEPSLGLAPVVVERLFATLGDIRERGVSILLVEQRAQLTIAFADRTHVIANGRLRLELGPPDAGATERSPAAMLVATFAISFLLQSIYLIAFGSRGQIVGVLGTLNSAFTVAGVDIRW